MEKGGQVKPDDTLAHYRQKRRFAETREPRGVLPDARKNGALYVIQKHDATRLHYDFRLELDGVLLSWAVTPGPSYDTKQKRLAVRTEDHPLEYGRFEGTIPKGNYGGGTVMLWDTGYWTPVGSPYEGLEKGKLVFELHGERLRGRWVLVRMRPRPKDKNENWLLIKERDAFAGGHENLLEEETRSVVSGREMEEIAQADQVWSAPDEMTDVPAFVEPMLTKLVDQPPRGSEWLFEIKYDGYRALIAADHDKVKICTRSGEDWTHRFGSIAKAFAELDMPSALLDAEIVVVDKSGRTDFSALAAALAGDKKPLSCFVFDLLSFAGEDWRTRSLERRKTRLKQLIGEPDKTAPIQYSEVFKGDGAALLKTACAHGLEGIIAKRVDSPYRSGRHDDWLKIKCQHAQEFIIIGFSDSNKRRAFASLLMAVQEPAGLRYAGRVGAGFSQSVLARLSQWRDKNTRKTPACDVPASRRGGVTWVRPELVAEVAFAGWTGDGLIRQGRFIGLREDKNPEDVEREIPMKTTLNVALTHPDRILYPDCGVTKAAVASYIQDATPLMFPYMEGRFISLVRCPEGVEKQCFFQRHLMAGFGEAWHSAEYAVRDGSSHDWPVVKDFSAALAARLAADSPDQFTATMSKAKRKGKIFIDHFRNEMTATAIAPFSPRARPDAAVAWPVSWAGLRNIEAANAMNIPKAQAAIKNGENSWAGYHQIQQRLSAAAIKAIAL